MSKLEEIADPELIARIIDWFGEPAAAPGPKPADEHDDPDVAAYYANIARACEAVTPQMLAYAQRHNDTADELAARDIPELSVADVACYSPDRAPRIGITPPGFYDQPDWVQRALQDENCPQAVLRDLHRPVSDFSTVGLERTEFHSDITGAGRARALRELMAQRYRIDITEFSLSWRTSRAALAELSELLAAPWQDSKPAKPMPKPSMYGPSLDNAYWFGD